MRPLVLQVLFYGVVRILPFSVQPVESLAKAVLLVLFWDVSLRVSAVVHLTQRLDFCALSHL